MKRSYFKNKLRKPLKRTRLRVVGHSSTADLKQEIQSTLRAIVMLRDKKCILYGIKCYNEIGVPGIVWQAEHLIERSNTGTFADTRLIVLICRNCHGWKHFTKSNHDQYDKWVKSRLSKERVDLWERCEREIHLTQKLGPKTDLKMELIGLKQELAKLESK